MNTSNWRLRRVNPETMTLLADWNGRTVRLADIYADTDLTEAALIMSAPRLQTEVQRLEADLKLADQAITDRLHIIHQQAATIKQLELICDSQDAIITRLRIEAVSQ